jgi:exoribonuclease R
MVQSCFSSLLSLSLIALSVKLFQDETLNKSYLERIKSHPSLTKLVRETDEIRKNLKETKVSLNEENRKKQMEEADRLRANAGIGSTLDGNETEVLATG